MKKLILIMLGLLIIPMVMASNEYGKITSGGDLLITDFDTKVDGLTSRNLDYGDEISRVAYPDSEIILQIELKNNHTSLDMTDIAVIATIDDLDLEEESIEFDLAYGKDKNIELAFTLPSDAEDKDYEIFVEVEGKLNNTVHVVEYILDLVVEFDDDEILTVDEKTTLDELKTAIDEMTTVQNYYEPYTTCTGKLATAEATIVTRDAAIATLNDYKAKYETCSGEKTLLNNQIITLQIEKEKLAINATSYMGEVKNVKDNRIYIIGAVILIAGYIIWKYKERLFPKSELNAGGETGK